MIDNLDALGSGRFMARYMDRYCYFGSSSKSSTTQNQQQAQTSSNTINPQQYQQYQDNYQHAQNAAANLTPYNGQLVAGFNPNQTQAQGIFSGIATNPASQYALQGATGAVQGILNNPINGQINPQSVSPTQISAPSFNAAQISQQAPVSASPVTAGLLAKTDLSPYLNPYTQDVINTTMAANERARQIAGMNNNQAATAGNAFGGARQGVADSLTNEAYDRNSLASLASLNSDNYNQAVAGATGDINRTLGADQFNSGQNLAAQQFNTNTNQAGQIYNANNAQAAGILGVQNNMAAQQANQAAGINTGEFNSGQNLTAQQQSVNNALSAAGLTMNAAGEIIPLSQASLADATNRAGLLATVGDQQQQQQQNELSAAYQAYTQGQQLTLAQQQLLSQALGMIPIQQTTNSSGTSNSQGTSQTQTNPGLGGILGGIGSLFSGVSALGGLGSLGGSLGAGSGVLGQLTGSNAVGYGGLLGAAAPTVSAANIPFPTFNPSSITMPRLS